MASLNQILALDRASYSYENQRSSISPPARSDRLRPPPSETNRPPPLSSSYTPSLGKPSDSDRSSFSSFAHSVLGPTTPKHRSASEMASPPPPSAHSTPSNSNFLLNALNDSSSSSSDANPLDSPSPPADRPLVRRSLLPAQATPNSLSARPTSTTTTRIRVVPPRATSGTSAGSEEYEHQLSLAEEKEEEGKEEEVEMDGLLPSAEEGDEYDEDDEGLREYLKDEMDPDLFDVQSDSGGDGRTVLSRSHSLSTVAAIEDLPDDSSQEAGPLVGESSRPLPSSGRPLDPAVLEEVQRRKETHTLRPVVGGKGKFWKASELPFEVLSYVLPPPLLPPPPLLLGHL